MFPFIFLALGSFLIGSEFVKKPSATPMKKGGRIKFVQAFAKGGEVEDEMIIMKRWVKKKNNIERLANNIRSLRYNITMDLKSDNEKVFLTALAIELMDKTAERVGNDESAAVGHFGITGLNKKHVTIDGHKIHFVYVGKSGVTHEKTITDEKLADNLKKAIAMSPNQYLLCTSNGFRIKSDRVNRYLSDFDVTAKDIRGYSCNKWLIDKLKDIHPGETDKERQKQFNAITKVVAKKVGHGNATLKKHYMIPELETSFVLNGKIFDIKKAAA